MAGDDPRDFQERVARNEVRFRAVNEDIDAGRPASDTTTLIPFVCECGQQDCHRLIELTPSEYGAVRADARQFAIVDGHELPSTEDVVERHERYTVVRKRGRGAQIARDVR